CGGEGARRMRRREEEGEEDTSEQEGFLQGRIKERKVRDAIREGGIIDVKINQALGKYLEI
ncbi:hypothetical protein ACQP3C_29705, partial [Escherichia coli]